MAMHILLFTYLYLCLYLPIRSLESRYRSAPYSSQETAMAWSGSGLIFSLQFTQARIAKLTSLIPLPRLSRAGIQVKRKPFNSRNQ
jgi:hypothetical protein